MIATHESRSYTQRMRYGALMGVTCRMTQWEKNFMQSIGTKISQSVELEKPEAGVLLGLAKKYKKEM